MDEKEIGGKSARPILLCVGPLKVMITGFDGQFTLFEAGPEPTCRLLSQESKISLAD